MTRVPLRSSRWRWRPPAVDWRPKLRRSAAESAVVVAGVWIAPALDAWWHLLTLDRTLAPVELGEARR